MNGKQFFERLESGGPGFLASFYAQHRGEVYTDANDEAVALALAPIAQAMGLSKLTGGMVQDARLQLGLKARTVGGPGPQAPVMVMAAAASPAPAIVQADLFPTPGERRIAEALEGLVKAAWAIHRELSRLARQPSIEEARRQDDAEAKGPVAA